MSTKNDVFMGFLSLTLWSALTLVLMRIIETVFVSYYDTGFWSHVLNNMLGACFDVVYLAVASLVLFVPYYFFSKMSIRRTSLVFRWLYAVVSLVAMLMISYFSQTGVPLDRVFFAYSLKEIIEIIDTSQTTAWWMYICIAIVPLFLLFVSRKTLKLNKIRCIIMGIIVWVCVVVRCVFYDSSMNNEGYYEQCNKICYFMKSVVSGGDVDDYSDEDLPVGAIREFQIGRAHV